MILRNPSAWRDSLFMTCSLFLYLFSYPISSQGVIGVVKENVSKQPIGAAIVSVMKGDSVIASLTTDNVGRYNYVSTKAGRIGVTIRALGYQSLTTDDILLDGYSTYRVENFLEINAFALDSVTIKATRSSKPFVHFISAEDLAYTAANFDDPVRVATSSPGIVQLNDQANHLSVRGKSPVFNSWYLEGLEIVNPNHTSNAGTFSDHPTQYGGGVNMFSAQILGSTTIYTGMNPLSIGNAAGAAIDMELHGSAKPEWRAKAGLLGFELGGGAALGTSSILDLNLRYSFTGLLANFGVDFGGEKIGFYDGVLSFRQQGQRHKLKLFAWAGRSENEFNKVENPEERERYKDFFDIDYGNDILGAGARYDLTLNPSLFLRSGFAYSANQSTYFTSGQFGTNPFLLDLNDQLSITSSFVEFSFLHSRRIYSTLGVHFTNRAYRKNQNRFLPFLEDSQIRPSLQFSAMIAPVVTFEIAGELYHSFTSDQSIPGFRAMLNYTIGETNKIYFGARHAAGEPANRRLVFISDNFELGWEVEGKLQHAGLNLYYQRMSHLAAFPLSDVSGPSEYLADYPNYYGGVLGLFSDGISKHTGVEGIWNLKSKKGWRLELNQSFYKSLRGREDMKPEPGRYDGRFATHFSVGKEIIKRKKDKNRIWNFSFRGLLNGGLWEPEINIAESESRGGTIFKYPFNYDQHLPMYKRIDASISRIIATKKIRWRYSLDIQNVIGFTNVAYHYYDPFLEQVTTQEQLGIIPVFAVQASW